MAVVVKPVAEGVKKAQEGRSVPECQVYEHENFNTTEGDQDGWSYRTALAVKYIGSDWNDQITSIIVYSGIWRFYEHADFQGDHIDYGPGGWNVPNEWNDRISSYEPISW